MNLISLVVPSCVSALEEWKVDRPQLCYDGNIDASHFYMMTLGYCVLTQCFISVIAHSASPHYVCVCWCCHEHEISCDAVPS